MNKSDLGSRAFTSSAPLPDPPTPAPADLSGIGPGAIRAAVLFFQPKKAPPAGSGKSLLTDDWE